MSRKKRKGLPRQETREERDVRLRNAARGLPLITRLDRLKSIYAKVPRTNCKGLCQEACGPIPVVDIERRVIENRVPNPDNRPTIYLPTDGKLLGESQVGHFAYYDLHAEACPMLGADGKCTIYDHRPIICRLFGSTTDLQCPHGCEPEGMLTKAEGDALLAEVKALDEGLHG